MIHLAPSESLANTYYIFRESGVEVKIVIRNNMILPSHNITSDEANYIREKILEKGEKIIK